jgi:hypothetical protein
MEKINFKDFSTAETLFPLAVFLMSFKSLSQQLNYLNLPALILSLIGIIGTVLFIYKNKYFKTFIRIWVLGQVLIITKQVLDVETGIWIEQPIWDLSQGLNFSFDFQLMSSTTKYCIKFNIAIIIFGALISGVESLMLSGKLVGKKLLFTAFREDTDFSNLFPMKGTVIKRITLDGENNWLLIHIDLSFDYEAQTITHVVIRSKNTKVVERHKQNQLISFMLVSNISEVLDVNKINSNFIFIDWVLCEIIE